MKKIIVVLLAAVFLVSSPTLAAKDFGLYWIGNSLMMGGWACDEGWDFVGKIMIDPDSANLGIVIHSAALKRGATDIPAQWQQDVAAGSGPCTGIGELNSPTGCITFQNPETWCAAQSHYDYLLLQGYRWTMFSNPADTEFKYCSLYYDLGLQNGTKPFIFACWQTPQSAPAAIAIYDSLYRKYRSRGAIYAPVIQAHQLVWNDKSKDSTYLYINGDPYHHINYRGSYLMDCVFYEVFTGHSPVGITLAKLLQYCTDTVSMDSMSAGDMSYLETTAHQAVINYYGAANVPHLGITATSVSMPVVASTPSALYSKSGVKLSVDLSGRRMNSSFYASSHVVIAKDELGRISRMVTIDK